MLTKEQAITKIMAQMPGMTKAVATYYVEEVLGYYAD